MIHQRRLRRQAHASMSRSWHVQPRVENLEARCLLSVIFRSVDGTGNNLANPNWGSAGTDLLRIAPASYSDGTSAMAGTDRPSPREISNAVGAQSTPIPNNRNMSDWVWQWGQFLDHDMDLTPTPGDPPEEVDVPVPAGDPFFDPNGTGTQVIQFARSVFDPATGTGMDNPRQQPNVITAFIDGSQVYGSDPVRAAALRTFEGGHLKTSTGDLLPYNVDGLPNANMGQFPDDELFLAGDVRANENIGLTAVQTLFMREHNWWADTLHELHPHWNDETLYQWARKIVGAEIEAITYNEFLPAIMGPDAPSIRGHYDATINPGIATEFSTAGFRVGHTLLSDQILRVQNNGIPDPRGAIPLASSFFNPGLISSGVDIDLMVKGLASQNAQEIDTHLVDGVRNFLFGPPGAGGFDLASLNIQRGRDHGLADYNTTRVYYGLPPVQSFADITSDPDLQAELQAEYGSVDNIDLWAGGLSEDHLPGSSLGPTFTAIFQDQFTRTRDGDSLFFENDPSFNRLEKVFLEHTTLADIIRRDTGITNIQADVFFFNGGDAPIGAPDPGLGIGTGFAPAVSLTAQPLAASRDMVATPLAANPFQHSSGSFATHTVSAVLDADVPLVSPASANNADPLVTAGVLDNLTI